MSPADRERMFVELYERHRRRLLRLCAAYLGSASEADDLFQDVMVNVWNGLPAFRGEADSATWIYRIAVNTALMSRRKVAREAAVIDRGRDSVPEPAAPAPPIDGGERMAELRRALVSLAPPDRICITLLLEGLSYKDIAAITGMTVNYVGVRILRAKRTLETLMRGR